jgi:prepilin-type N-terminal cleavage/methylation domain-containing protein
MIYQHPKQKGFTLAELLIGLMVMSVIFSAIAALAFSLGSANRATSEMGLNQALLRQLTLRFADLVRKSNQVISADPTNIVLWADGNADGVIDASEQITIRTDTGNSAVIINDNEQYTQCLNVQFSWDVDPPDTKCVWISFDLQEDQATHNYQITASLRASAEHLGG